MMLIGIREKLMLGAGVIIIILAGFFLLRVQVENRHLSKLNTQLNARINDQETGYIVQLARANTNVATLRTAIDRQNTALRTNAAAADRRATTLTAELARVERVNAGLRADAARILATPPAGNTLEERVLDIDKRVLETLQ